MCGRRSMEQRKLVNHYDVELHASLTRWELTLAAFSLQGRYLQRARTHFQKATLHFWFGNLMHYSRWSQQNTSLQHFAYVFMMKHCMRRFHARIERKIQANQHLKLQQTAAHQRYHRRLLWVIFRRLHAASVKSKNVRAKQLAAIYRQLYKRLVHTIKHWCQEKKEWKVQRVTFQRLATLAIAKLGAIRILQAWKVWRWRLVKRLLDGQIWLRACDAHHKLALLRAFRRWTLWRISEMRVRKCSRLANTLLQNSQIRRTFRLIRVSTSRARASLRAHLSSTRWRVFCTNSSNVDQVFRYWKFIRLCFAVNTWELFVQRRRLYSQMRERSTLERRWALLKEGYRWLYKSSYPESTHSGPAGIVDIVFKAWKKLASIGRRSHPGESFDTHEVSRLGYMHASPRFMAVGGLLELYSPADPLARAPPHTADWLYLNEEPPCRYLQIRSAASDVVVLEDAPILFRGEGPDRITQQVRIELARAILDLTAEMHSNLTTTVASDALSPAEWRKTADF